MDEQLEFIASVIQACTNDDSVVLSSSDTMDTVEKWDSLVTVNMAMALAERFGLDIGVDDLEKLGSVQGILDLIAEAE